MTSINHSIHHRVLNIILSLLIGTFVSACGGGGGSGSPSVSTVNSSGTNASINSEALTSGSSDTSLVAGSGGLLGDYILTATSNDSSSNPLVDCSVTPGRITVYEGTIVGYVDGYLTVSGTVDNRGNVEAQAVSGSTQIASLNGRINENSGSGTWNQPGLCAGDWQVERVVYPSTSTDEIFVLPVDNFPAALFVRFNSDVEFSTEGNACTDAEGVVETNSYIGSSDKEIDYRGYATTTVGYRWDVDISIYTDSGEVEGTYKYDPLGIYGSLDGDAYFAVTDRPYSAGYGSNDSGCTGT